ncbi:Phenyloxazoline synthase MbtB [Oligella ureolytica]|uniref:phosphopantetheine-binding protein n=1 Tax=Oligella ureolytica TaxID=90244 RepID=UPI000E03A568|nr:phosphopantetheine-binding protein [Oligella ureolytica]SUA54374.1 Phenyloxazoline synthase MbtB [Oligella ureolytica]
MKKMTDLGLSAWIDSQKSGLTSFIYIEFKAHNLDLDLFVQSVHEVVNDTDVFEYLITQEGQLAAREDGTQSLHLNIMSMVGESNFGRREKTLGDLAKYGIDTPLNNSVFLIINCLKQANGVVRIVFMANMAILNPANLYSLIYKIAIDYQSNQSSAVNALWVVPNITANYPVTELTTERYADLTSSSIPSLPWKFYNESSGDVKNICYCLSHEIWKQLNELAAANGLEVSAMFRTILCVAVGLVSKEHRFRLNLPFFINIVDDDGTDSDYVEDFFLQDINLNFKEPLLNNINKLSDPNSFYGNKEYSGVEVLRNLTSKTGKQEIAPLVYTDLLNSGELFGGVIHKTFGEVEFCVSRGANVAIDVQVLRLRGSICFNWDINQDLISYEAANVLFETFKGLLEVFTSNQDAINLPLEQATSMFSFHETQGDELERQHLIAGKWLTNEKLQQLLAKILNRRVKVETDLTLIVDSAEYQPLSVHEIHNILSFHFLGQFAPKKIFVLPIKDFANYEQVLRDDEQNLLDTKLDSQSFAPIDVVNVVSIIFSHVLRRHLDVKTVKGVDFFDMGGNSLMATQVVIEINKYFIYTKIGIADVFRLRSINELAVYLYQQDPESSLRVAKTVMNLLVSVGRGK